MNKKKIIYITIMITVITFLLSNIVWAKYYNNYDETLKAKIAIPIIELSKETEENEVITANQGANIILNVSNYNDKNISQVGQNYYLQFYSDEIDISKVNITVMNGENDIQIKNGISETRYIKANQKETHKYNVKITSNTTDTLQGNIKVRIISKQVEPK